MIKSFKKEVLKDKIFYFSYIIVFLIIIYLRDILNINIPIIITTVLITIYMLFGHDSVSEILAFLVPFRSVVQGNYILGISIFIFLLKERKKIRISKSIILLFVVLIIELINCINEFSYIKEYITFAILMILLYFTANSIKDNKEKEGIIKNYIIGTATSTMIFLLKTFRYIPLQNFTELKYRLGTLSQFFDIKQYNLNYNANELAIYVLIAITLILVLKNKDKISKSIYYILFIYFSVIGILTMSRAFIITSVIIFVIYLFLNKKKIKMVFLPLTILVTVFLIVLNSGGVFTQGIINNFKGRFEEEDLSGGRMEIIKAYNGIIFSSPKSFLIGSGTQNYNLKNNYEYSSHNAIQESIVCFGILGSISFIILIYTYYSNSITCNNKKDIIEHLPIIALLIMIQTIPVVTQGLFLLMFYVAISSLELYKQNNYF